jgi:antirestriction protein ArdC
MVTSNAFDIHAHITDQIIAGIEAGVADWQMPWRRAQGALHRPQNAATGKAYQGVNILSLWVAAEHHGYSMPLWATYKQWQEKGAQVCKGERGTPIVFYKELERTSEEGADNAETQRTMFARASWVFNAAQVEGFAPPIADEVSLENRITPIDAAEALIQATGATVRETGDRAFYNWSEDYVGMPERARFTGTDSSTPTDAWYATHLHELTHWTGAKHRLDRDLANRFGSEAYAMEELIAELGSAFLCADLGLTSAPRPDHAAYVAHWLKVLKDDKRAIFAAASQADRAARYLTALAPVPHRPGPPDPEAEAPALG